MQPARPPRGPGSFSPLRPPSPPPTSAALVAATAANNSSRASLSPTFDQPSRMAPTPPTRPRRDSPVTGDENPRLSALPSPLTINKMRQQIPTQQTQTQSQQPGIAGSASTSAPPTAAPPAHSNFSRPTPVTAAVAAAAAARQNANANAAATAAAASAASAGAAGLNVAAGETLRAVSPLPLTLPTASSSSNNTNTAAEKTATAAPTSPIASFKPSHSRKHSQTAGLFDVSLPSTNGGGSLSQVINAQQQGQGQQNARPSSRGGVNTPPLQERREMSASQIAAQAAVLHHKQGTAQGHGQGQGQGSAKLTPQQQQQLQQAQQSQMVQQQQQQQQQIQGHPAQHAQYAHSQPPSLYQQHSLQHQTGPPQHVPQHSRQRSQTVPAPGESYEAVAAASNTGSINKNKRSSGGPLVPPTLSLTEASAPRESGFGNQTYHNGLLGSHTSAAQTAANVVFARSGGPPSPKMAQQAQQAQQAQHAPLPPLPPPPPVPEKKAEKSKVKLFSRPGKISTKGDAKDKPLPSPNKMGISSALASLQRANFSTTSLDSSSQSSFYSLGNSSAATIRAADSGMGLGMGMGMGMGLGLVGSSSSATLGGVGGSGGLGLTNTAAGGAPTFYEKDSTASTAGGKDGKDKDGKESKDGKEGKEKKHHFLSRQKHKLKDKDDFHLPLSSAASNSRPTDPNAPRSLYNFSLPPNSPGPASTTFKSMSGLDLRHGARALRDKKKDKEDKAAAAAAAAAAASAVNIAANGDYTRAASIELGGMGGMAGMGGGMGGGGAGSVQGDGWPGPGSYGSGGAGLLADSAVDAAKYGSSNLSYDDAWPYLKAKLQVIFEGEDLRIPVELLNRVVVMHIQYCIQRRSPNIILEDLRDLLTMGFASLDRTLRQTPEDRLIPALVELWLFTFTSILPYMQAVFLPLDLEFAGMGTLLTPEQARDFWGGVTATTATTAAATAATTATTASPAVAPVSAVLDVRRLVLASYRDTVILPRYDTLKPIFSRLSLEFLPQSLAGMALARASPTMMTSPSSISMGMGMGMGMGASQTKPIPIQQRPGRSNSSLAAAAAHSYGSFGSTTTSNDRPGTAMSSLDPSGTATLNLNLSGSNDTGGGGMASGSRSRAISNVSFASSNEPRPSFSSSVSGGALTTVTSVSNSNSNGNTNGNGNANGNANANGAGPPPSSGGASLLGSVREQNVEDSKQVTEMVGRMLQCMSVLAGVGVAGESSSSAAATNAAAPDGDDGNRRVEELSRLLKLNWLGRGRTGRNRRGMVGGRVKRGAGLPGGGAGGAGGAGSGGESFATRQGLSVA
ncbi:HbrB-domain-containing protein [Sporothrix brasiliensis 5110]|uniref:HbrB-domain-containing protein n=1 Tax=Sporothrix brasiliensis 5110 TaxID=1398154 RepID=A0A0C2J0R3_9PEZI|nr:HbrB-domain-containing protein [Sporothrix brasiliensis 5110]KIH90737.1 HbrB-domain-containing protein [Sporothrix brasiliensis 5110]